MMEREDIYRLSEDILNTVIAHPPSDAASYLFRTTSGTSGAKPLVLITGYSPEAPKDVAGGRRFERAVSFNGSVSSRLANAFIISRAPADEAMRILPLDPEDLSPPLGELLEDYEPDLVNGFASYIARGLKYFSPSAGAGVGRVTLFGEGMSPAFEQSLHEAFPHAEQAELYMALEAGGYIGTRFCAHLPRGHFHPARGVTLEVAGPDADGVGDLLVSKTIFPSVELLRYRIGDAGRMVQEACACGEPVTFELLGRSGIDYIKLGGAIFTRDEFDRAVAKFPAFIDDYRVEVDAGRGSARVLVYRRAGAGTEGLAQELAAKISHSLFVTQTKTYQDLVDTGALLPLEVAFSREPFARGHKDVKLRSVSA